MSCPLRNPAPSPRCRETGEPCRSARRRDPDELDVHHLTPLAIARAEMLAAVDEIMDTFRAHG